MRKSSTKQDNIERERKLETASEVPSGPSFNSVELLRRLRVVPCLLPSHRKPHSMSPPNICSNRAVMRNVLAHLSFQLAFDFDPCEFVFCTVLCRFGEYRANFSPLFQGGKWGGRERCWWRSRGSRGRREERGEVCHFRRRELAHFCSVMDLQPSE